MAVALISGATPVLAGPSAAPAAMDPSGGWVRIVPKPLTINGRPYRPTCSGAPGTTSSTYAF